MVEKSRPLSPHVGIYNWQISNTLSILHRLTGVAMSIGAVVFAGWLIAVSGSAEGYQSYMALICSPLGVLAVGGWTFCFFYHLCNGLRHLCWDMGYGFEKSRAVVTGWVVVAVSLALTVLFLAAAMARFGGAS